MATENYTMTNRLLITGMGGFAGSHILEHFLINTDWDIVGIDSWRHKGTPERIEEVLNGHPEWKARVTMITHDLIAPIPERTQKRIGHIDYIINCAAESHVERSIEDPVPFVTNNVAVALNMLEYARTAKPRAYIQISTDEVYGAAPRDTNHKEWSPIIPSNPYSASKAAQEDISIAYWRTYGVPVIITNTMNMFGEMQDSEKYLAKSIRIIHDGGTLTVHGKEGQIGSRYYLHSRNHADALLYLLENTVPSMFPESDRPDRYNIVGDQELTNLEVAQMIADILGKPLKYELVDFHSVRPGHDPRYALDGAKIRALGWKSPLPLKESLERYINWTLKHPIWL